MDLVGFEPHDHDRNSLDHALPLSYRPKFIKFNNLYLSLYI